MPGGRPAARTLRGLLGLICLAVLATVQTHRRLSCGLETIQLVGDLLQRVQDMEIDTRLYTPTLDNYENCSRSTLSCFASEARVLNSVWPTLVPLSQPANRMRPRRKQALGQRRTLAKRLTTIRIQLQQTDRGHCGQCETHAAEEVTVFLERLYEVLQRIHSNFCSSSTDPGPHS